MTHRRSIPLTFGLAMLLVLPAQAIAESPSPLAAVEAVATSEPVVSCPDPSSDGAPDSGDASLGLDQQPLQPATDCPLGYEVVFTELVGEVPGTQALLAQYPGVQQSNTLYRNRPFKTVRTVTWDSLPPIGEAARLCLQGPFGLKGRGAISERQRGCFMAIRGEWERYLAAYPDPTADEHLARAQATYTHAMSRLRGEDAHWLTRALERELPRVEPAVSPWDAEPGRSKLTAKKFLSSKPRRVSATAFLQAIRDAQAVDRTYVPGWLSQDEWLGIVGDGPMAGEGTPDFRRGDRIASVTMPAMCVKPAVTEPKGTGASDGIAFTLPRKQTACWPVVQALWRAYRVTGSPAYLEAARTAWDYFRSRFSERPGTPGFSRLTQYNGGLR